MNYFQNLRDKIKKNNAVICVVGLGYVGSAILKKFNKAGFKTIGIDKDKRKIKKKSKNRKMILTDNYKFVHLADIIIIALPTPLTRTMSPDLSHIEDCLIKMRKYIKRGQLISLESTTYPGTTEEELVISARDMSWQG